jgi:hypothetical protein
MNRWNSPTRRCKSLGSLKFSGARWRIRRAVGKVWEALEFTGAPLENSAGRWRFLRAVGILRRAIRKVWRPSKFLELFGILQRAFGEFCEPPEIPTRGGKNLGAAKISWGSLAFSCEPLENSGSRWKFPAGRLNPEEAP